MTHFMSAATRRPHNESKTTLLLLILFYRLQLFCDITCTYEYLSCFLGGVFCTMLDQLQAAVINL